MRILQLVNAIDRDQLGGMQRYVGELAGALAERGHEVTVATKRVDRGLPARERLPSGARLIRLDVPDRSARTYAVRYPTQLSLATARLVRSVRFDVVHGHFGPQGFGCRLAGVPYVYTFHAPAWAEITEERERRYAWPTGLNGAARTGMRMLERAAVLGASDLIVLSRFMRDQMLALAPECRWPRLLPGGVDTAFFSPGDPLSLAGDEWASHAGPLLFCARRLVPRTGVETLVDAAGLVIARIPDLRVAIAGSGPLTDRIAERAARLGIGEQLRMLGRVTNRQLRDWYRRATLAVTPTSHLEGFGLATAEAMACGTPVVGTPAGATSELLAPLDGRLIAGDGSALALAQTIASALDRKPELPELGARARALATREWSLAAVAERHEAVYESLAAGR